MAIQVGGTTVVSNTRGLNNIASVDATTVTTLSNAGVGASPFQYDAVSGATQALDVGSHNFFDAGTLTADTTVSFSNVPTEARWTYTFVVGGVAPDLPNASNTGKNIFVGSQDGTPEGLAISQDGTKIYYLGRDNNSVYQYDMSVAFDLATAVYNSVSFDFTSQQTAVRDLSFKPDGTKMYMVGDNGDTVYQYSLSTAWDVSTASYDSKSFSVGSQDLAPYGMDFKSDGTKMYIIGTLNGKVFQYSLSTAWDVSTASYDSKSLTVSGQEATPHAVRFNGDGTKLFVMGTTNKTLYQYDLSTAWDVSTGSYSSVNLPLNTLVSNPQGFCFNRSYNFLYFVSNTQDRMYQFDVGTPYTLTLPASVENPPSSSLQIGNTTTYKFFTADGGTTVTFIGEENT